MLTCSLFLHSCACTWLARGRGTPDGVTAAERAVIWLAPNHTDSRQCGRRRLMRLRLRLRPRRLPLLLRLSALSRSVSRDELMLPAARLPQACLA
eukprot:scaffold232226_cov22-Tisochrysis_lutea.AAC.1